MQKKYGFALLGLLAGMAVMAFAGDVPVKPETGAAVGDMGDQTTKRLDKMKDLATGKTSLPHDAGGTMPTQQIDSAFPQRPPEFVKDPDTYRKYLLSLQEYFDYRISGLKHRRDVFDWQLRSSKIIFIIVILLVVAGVYFAAVQFHMEIRKRSEGEVAPPRQDKVVVGPKGVEVSSGVLGVIILTLSLAFFYLYLVYVYPIEDTF